jgi:hypothetical protein
VTNKQSAGENALIRIGSASGEAEALLWKEALKQAGIDAHIKTVAHSAWFTSPDAFEFWVSPQDAERARDALAL